MKKSKKVTPKPGKTYGTMGYNMQRPLKQGSSGTLGKNVAYQPGTLKK
jgi:hypothetical protein